MVYAMASPASGSAAKFIVATLVALDAFSATENGPDDGKTGASFTSVILTVMV